MSQTIQYQYVFAAVRSSLMPISSIISISNVFSFGKNVISSTSFAFVSFGRSKYSFGLLKSNVSVFDAGMGISRPVRSDTRIFEPSSE